MEKQRSRYKSKRGPTATAIFFSLLVHRNSCESSSARHKYADADGMAHYGDKFHKEEKHISYDYSYKVHDDDSGASYSHQENRNGEVTKGEYRVSLPDGRLQIVSYVADDNGYRAKVTYEPSDQIGRIQKSKSFSSYGANSKAKTKDRYIPSTARPSKYKSPTKRPVYTTSFIPTGKPHSIFKPVISSTSFPSVNFQRPSNANSFYSSYVDLGPSYNFNNIRGKELPPPPPPPSSSLPEIDTPSIFSEHLAREIPDTSRSDSSVYYIPLVENSTSRPLYKLPNGQEFTFNPLSAVPQLAELSDDKFDDDVYKARSPFNTNFVLNEDAKVSSQKFKLIPVPLQGEKDNNHRIPFKETTKTKVKSSNEERANNLQTTLTTQAFDVQDRTTSNPIIQSVSPYTTLRDSKHRIPHPLSHALSSHHSVHPHGVPHGVHNAPQFLPLYGPAYGPPYVNSPPRRLKGRIRRLPGSLRFRRKLYLPRSFFQNEEEFVSTGDEEKKEEGSEADDP